MNRETTCSFTGHRSIDKKHIRPLQKQLNLTISRLIDKGYTRFCSGGALGFDLMAAQAVIRFKKKNPALRLCMVLPCRNQVRFWSEEQRRLYQKVLCAADEIIYTAETYYQGCMQKRNRYLVDMAGCVVTYLTQDCGGTKYTVDYADKTGVPIIFLQNTSPRQLHFFD